MLRREGAALRCRIVWRDSVGAGPAAPPKSSPDTSAGRGTRTLKGLRPGDFESPASANSAIPAHLRVDLMLASRTGASKSALHPRTPGTCHRNGTGPYFEPVSLALEAKDVVHRFGETVALGGVSIDVPAGTMAALVGESGSGKTTLLRSFNRMIQPDSGTLHVGGEDVREPDPIVLRRRIGYVPQHGGLLPHWTVLRNVALVPRLVGAADPYAAAAEALALVGLDPDRFGHRLPRDVSGGQRQRAAIARALAARQGAMLLDEPFGALDAISRAETHEAFARVRSEIGFTAVLVTHDLAEAAQLADTIAVMRSGRVEQIGALDELRRSPATEYVHRLLARSTSAAAALGVH